MQKSQLIPVALGLLIGGGLGALMGYFGKCSTGACPLTANPWRGAFIGAMLGGILMWTSGSSSPVAEAAGSGRYAVQISDAAAFESRVLHAVRPVLVDFYSDSCPPCHKLAPTVEKIAKQYEGRAVICKVNVNKLPQLAARYGIEAIPSVLFFKEGQEVQRLVGLHDEPAYTHILDTLQ